MTPADVKALEALRDEMRQWLDPNGWVVDGDQPDVMVSRWADRLDALLHEAGRPDVVLCSCPVVTGGQIARSLSCSIHGAGRTKARTMGDAESTAAADR
jgi:hypothetical protein